MGYKKLILHPSLGDKTSIGDFQIFILTKIVELLRARPWDIHRLKIEYISYWWNFSYILMLSKLLTEFSKIAVMR